MTRYTWAVKVHGIGNPISLGFCSTHLFTTEAAAIAAVDRYMRAAEEQGYITKEVLPTERSFVAHGHNGTLRVHISVDRWTQVIDRPYIPFHIDETLDEKRDA